MNLYSLKARIYPVILSVIPILVIGILFSVTFNSYYQTLGGLGITTVLFFLFSQLGRDRGKKLEKDLWNKWGGAPSTQILRLRDNTLNSVTKTQYHKIMNSLVETEVKPNSDLESTSPELCDEVYTAWVKYLIGKTRDTNKFNLLFAENINYGFRRNSLGLKPFALTVLIVLYALIIIANYLNFGTWNFKDLNSLLAICILLLPLLYWLFIVNRNWVEIPAFAYAERLAESIEEIKNAPQHGV
tara:strand:- start:203 stop:931 length:729 start_codon:yes stop_codon:yes gene_type:complete